MLRFGHSVRRVPVERAVSVRNRAVSGHRRNLVLDGDALTMAVMGDSNLELRFEPPVAIEVGAVSRTFTRVAFFVDDPRAAAALLRAAAVSGCSSVQVAVERPGRAVQVHDVADHPDGRRADRSRRRPPGGDRRGSSGRCAGWPSSRR